MKAQTLVSLRRVDGWLLSAALLVSAALTGCQSPYQALQVLANQHGGQAQILPTQPFPLALGSSVQRFTASRIRVYLEGDGHAWATASQPSLDPSPRHLLVAQLALSDPTPSLYLARPCQYVTTPDCNPYVWTDRRFSEEVVVSLEQALDMIKVRFANRDFELVGYSGGGALALVLAARRDDIALVQTLAGNLSPGQWTKLHHLSPLVDSLDPLDYRARLAQIPQRHLLGANDRIVPPILLLNYRNRLGEVRCLESVVLKETTHSDGWAEAWPLWRERPLDCHRPLSTTIESK